MEDHSRESDSGSTVPRRQLGRHLRQLREEAGIQVGVVAEEMEWSGQKIWRIERGLHPVRVMDAKNLCALYGADRRTTEALAALARETKAKGWWHSYGGAIPKWFELYVGLEAAAAHLRTYHPELVDGLLQTEAYATEVIGLMPGISEPEVASGVAARLRRQKLLTRTAPPPPWLEVVIGEAALRRPLRTAGETAAQLRHLAAVSHRPHVTIRVLPLAAGLTAGVLASGMFTILDFPTGRRGAGEPTTVYCAEGLTGGLYLDQPAEITAYETVWSRLAEASLSAPESREMINQLAEAT